MLLQICIAEQYSTDAYTLHPNDELNPAGLQNQQVALADRPRSDQDLVAAQVDGPDDQFLNGFFEGRNIDGRRNLA